jgi:hypothetical protein
VQPAFASLLSYKRFNTRGISQLAINGTSVDATLDQYAATDSYATNDYGAFTFPTARNDSFKFTVTAKNASSSGYTVSFDGLGLTRNKPASSVAQASARVKTPATRQGTPTCPI